MKHSTDLETGNFKGLKDQAYPLNMAASLMWLMNMGPGNIGTHPGMQPEPPPCYLQV